MPRSGRHVQTLLSVHVSVARHLRNSALCWGPARLELLEQLLERQVAIAVERSFFNRSKSKYYVETVSHRGNRLISVVRQIGKKLLIIAIDMEFTGDCFDSDGFQGATYTWRDKQYVLRGTTRIASLDLVGNAEQAGWQCPMDSRVEPFVAKCGYPDAILHTILRDIPSDRRAASMNAQVAFHFGFPRAHFTKLCIPGHASIEDWPLTRNGAIVPLRAPPSFEQIPILVSSASSRDCDGAALPVDPQFGLLAHMISCTTPVIFGGDNDLLPRGFPATTSMQCHSISGNTYPAVVNSAEKWKTHAPPEG